MGYAKTLFLLVFLFALFGCSSKNYMPEDLGASQISFITQDIGKFCAESVSKNQVLGFMNDELSAELAEWLAGDGYTTVYYHAGNKKKGLNNSDITWVTYTVDYLAEDKMYVNVNVGEKTKLTRLYIITGDKLTPKEKLLGRVME